MKYWVFALFLIVTGIVMLMKGVSGLTMSAHKPALREDLLFPEEFIVRIEEDEVKNLHLTEERIEVRKHYQEKMSSAEDAFWTLTTIGVIHIGFGLLVVLTTIVRRFWSDWQKLKTENEVEQDAASDP